MNKTRNFISCTITTYEHMNIRKTFKIINAKTQVTTNYLLLTQGKSIGEKKA